jgi:Lrp/AsnC family transcriptional regulator, regulator for asnA, asnC and gidA
MVIRMEDADKKILNVLVENSRLSYRQIAKKVGVSVATVMHHVKRLEKEKIIKGYTLSLDYDKLGFDVQVIVDLRISKGKLYQVENKIAIHPNVFAIYDNTGPFDATIVAKFKSRKAMDNFLKEIQSFDFVERTETKLILSTIKEKDMKV